MAKILIVDDSALSRRTMRRILESDGHSIIEANDGMVALEYYFLEKPDLVLLDLVMNGMQGVEVLEQLLQMDHQVRVIIATADLQTLTQTAVKKAGAVGFINKPFVAPAVLSAVHEALYRNEDFKTESHPQT
jgi:two-component system chemotaxis response regulator CheY